MVAGGGKGGGGAGEGERMMATQFVSSLGFRVRKRESTWSLSVRVEISSSTSSLQERKDDWPYACNSITMQPA
jgi:hypothetical protein